jgi:hypothetical protein
MSLLVFLVCRGATFDGFDHVTFEPATVLVPFGDEVEVVDGGDDSECRFGFGLPESAEGVSERMVWDFLVGRIV